LTIVPLIFASILAHGFIIDGVASWLATVAVVWLVTTIAAITLPELLIHDESPRYQRGDNEPRHRQRDARDDPCRNR
jgi:hypothetical protein